MDYHEYTPEEIMELIKDGKTPEKISTDIHISIEKIYSKISEYQDKYGKIGNIGAIIKEAKSPAKLAALFREGKTVAEIAKQKSMTKGAVIQKIRDYEQKTGEQILPPELNNANRTVPKETKPKERSRTLSMNELKKIIIDSYLNGNSASDIEAHFKTIGYKTISINYILRVISDYIQERTVRKCSKEVRAKKRKRKN